MKTGTELARRDSIEQIVAHRDKALECFRRAAELIDEGNRAIKRAGGRRISTEAIDDLRCEIVMHRFIEQARKDMDGELWLAILQKTTLDTLMDAETLKRFREQVTKDAPHFTVDNVTATIADQASKSEETFNKGVASAFRSLSRDHKTNDGFKIGPKAIFTCAVSSYGLSYGWKRDVINDIDRVFHVLDGKPWEGRGGLADAIAEIVSKVRDVQPGTCETAYFAVKWFKNGNLHVTFKRADLLERVNVALAKHYGETLGNGECRR